jgi:hypothetical protein
VNLRRVVVGSGVALAVTVAVVVGEGLTGRHDKFFDVSLVNRTGRTVSVDNHGAVYRLRPGKTDTESGSSTAHQPIRLRLGHLQTCADLFFSKQPVRPLAIELRDNHVLVRSAPAC